MAHPMGESKDGVLRLGLDRRLKLEFHGSKVTSDAGLLPYRELDDAVGLTAIAGDVLTDTRRGKNGRHGLVGQFRQSVFGRLGGYDDVNDADRLGCLQDIHWYDGAWGYFPTYTLGAMTAAQLHDAAVQACPEIPEALARGDFAPLLGWLRAAVHEKGSLLTGDELLTQATGRPLDPEVFKAHLAARYLGE